MKKQQQQYSDGDGEEKEEENLFRGKFQFEHACKKKQSDR